MNTTAPKYVTLREEETVTIVLAYKETTQTLPVQTYTQLNPRTLEPVTDEGILFIGDVRMLRELAAQVVEQCAEIDALAAHNDALRAELATRQDAPVQAAQAAQ